MAYAGTADLARVLHLRNVTGDQGTAMEICLDAAMYEINSEINGSGTVDLGTPYPSIAVQVNLDRAVEHWQQSESPFGLIGLGAETLAVTSKDSWDRHRFKLVPLKTTWGVA